MEKKWRLIAKNILEFLEVPDESWPDFFIGAHERTRTTNNRETKVIEEIHFKLTDDEGYNLVCIFHECWHVRQLFKGLDCFYSYEDNERYAKTGQHMYMLYKYDFELEAQGHAWAFAYYYYLIKKLCHGEPVDSKIAQYSVMDQGNIDDFDSPNDCLNFNQKLKDAYENAKPFFEYKMKEYINKDLEELCKDCEDSKKVFLSKLYWLVALISPRPRN